jgi:acyl carrier protein
MSICERDVCEHLIALARRLTVHDVAIDENVTLLDERIGLDSLAIGDFLGGVEGKFAIAISDDDVADWLQAPFGVMASWIASTKPAGG